MTSNVNDIPEFKSHEFYGWETKAFTDDPHVVFSEYFLIYMILLVISLIIQYQVSFVWKIKYLPEIGAVLIVGIWLGGLITLIDTLNSTSELISSVSTTSTVIAYQLLTRISNSTLVSMSSKYNDDTLDTQSQTGSSQFNVNYLGFSSNVFYFVFLPIIIFNSGYHLKRQLFYQNFDAILSLSVIGTSISTISITLGLYLLKTYHLCDQLQSFSVIEMIAWASLISSTDPISTLAVFSSMKVDPTLFYLG